MKNILELSREELTDWLENNGVRAFRVKQIFKWLYLKLACDFDDMTDLGKPLRALMKENFVIGNMAVVHKEVSNDTTEKFLFRLQDGECVETVLIPEKGHYTLCVSSQVGCAMACKFCLTAKNGLKRNLTAGEIIDQVRSIRRYIMTEKDMDPLALSNIVFMGMGEPLANYDNLIKALGILKDTDHGMKFSSRRITVSTSGLVPKIGALGHDVEVNLAVSLNAVDNETRSQLMPINNTYDIQSLLAACRQYKMKPRNKITFEYILMAGINDSDAHAKKLVRILTPIRAKILKILLDRNMTAIVRKSKGDDISAACGQLNAKKNPVQTGCPQAVETMFTHVP